MPLPIVQGSEVATPSSGVQMDSSAFRNAALAPGKVAAAIGQDVGGLFQDVSNKIQDARNARTIFQADLAMRKTKDDFTADLVTMPDETTWLDAYKQRVDQTREAILQGPNVGPDVKKALNNKFDIWEASTTSEIRGAALLKGVNEGRKDAIADSTYAAHGGDVDGARNIMQAAVEHGFFNAKEAGRLSIKFPQMAAQAQADTAISTDPINAPDRIKKLEGQIEPRMFVGIQARANEARNRAQASNTNDWAERLDNSPDGTIDPQGLKDDVKAGNITQRSADGLLARMAKKKLDTAKDDYTVAAMQAHDHDFTEDKKPEETARQMKDEAAHLPAALRIRLYNEIDNKVKAAQKKGESEERPVERQVLDLMREDREHNGTTVPMFMQTTPAKTHFFSADEPATTQSRHVAGGLNMLRNPEKYSDNQIANDFGNGVTRDQVIQAEQLHYATMQAKMRAWFKDPSNKDADIDKANAYRLELEKPFVFGQVAAHLSPAAPASATWEFKTQADAQAAIDAGEVKEGDKFLINGKPHTYR